MLFWESLSWNNLIGKGFRDQPSWSCNIIFQKLIYSNFSIYDQESDALELATEVQSNVAIKPGRTRKLVPRHLNYYYDYNYFFHKDCKVFRVTRLEALSIRFLFRTTYIQFAKLITKSLFQRYYRIFSNNFLSADQSHDPPSLSVLPPLPRFVLYVEGCCCISNSILYHLTDIS